ncbi:hypothetical protein D3C85_1275760 [compost metagenome]
MDSAASRFPPRNSAMRVNSTGFRGRRANARTVNGVPMASASAYKPTRLPARARGMSRSVAIAGRMPTTMNSAIPIAKAVTAKASTPG